MKIVLCANGSVVQMRGSCGTRGPRVFAVEVGKGGTDCVGGHFYVGWFRGDTFCVLISISVGQCHV